MRLNLANFLPALGDAPRAIEYQQQRLAILQANVTAKGQGKRC